MGAGRGRAGGSSPNAHRQGAQSRTKVPSPRPAVGEPRTRLRRCPCPGNARVAEDRPGSGRREPGGRHGGGGAGPSRPRPRPAPRAAPQLPETEPSLLLSKLSAQRARVENRSLQPVCPGWALRGGHWFAGARELAPSSARGRTHRPAIPNPPPPATSRPLTVLRSAFRGRQLLVRLEVLRLGLLAPRHAANSSRAPRGTAASAGRPAGTARGGRASAGRGARAAAAAAARAAHGAE